VQTLALPELIDARAPGRWRGLRPWRFGALALLACAAAYAGWQLARPLAADQLAAAMPPALEAQLGQGILHALERGTLAPSALSVWHQQRISDAFAGLQAPHEGAPRHRLLFRAGHMGAAAFALPSGDIVVTDALVLALPDDGAVLAVLAHELGHLQRRHMLPRLAEEALLATAAGIVLGDTGWLVSSVAPRVPHLAWTQQAEIDADKYAADLLEHNGLPLRSLPEAYEALAAATGGPPAYLAIHPPGAERMALQRDRSAP
jgi:Zn-dependent protease with chaperone function